MAFFTNSEGIAISYRETGDPKGTAILFFDGWPAPYAVSINPVALSLTKKGMRVIEFDYRGFGKSGTSVHNSMARCAKDAKELLEHLKIDRAVFFGGSMGLSAILGYCKAYGMEHILGIIGYDQPACLTNREGWNLGRLRGQQDYESFLAQMNHLCDDPLAAIEANNASASPAAWPELGIEDKQGVYTHKLIEQYPEIMQDPAFLEAFGIMQEKGIAGMMDPLALVATWFDSGYQDYRAVLPTITVPVLYFAPKPGSVYSYESSEYYRDNLGGPVTFVDVEPASHLLLYEKFEEILPIVDDFLVSLTS